MTERLYLHVGAPKSGTTTIQQRLVRNAAQLAENGVWVATDRLECIHAAMVVRDDPRLRKLPRRAADSWARLVAQVRDWPGESAIISYELFGGATAEQVAAALAELRDTEVHIVISARDLGRAVPSAWQERLKFALPVALEEWTPPPEEAGPRAEWGWRTMDPSGVARRWVQGGVPADRVHIVTVPRSSDDGELWHRFAEACGLGEVGLKDAPERRNQSLGLAAAEVLRRVNEHLAGPLRESDRLLSVWLRDELAHEVLVPLAGEPIGLTTAQYDEAAARSAEAIAEIERQGYRVHGDLADLRAEPSSARTPAQLSDQELLEVAVRALAASVSRQSMSTARRDRGSAGPGAPVAAAGGGRRDRSVRSWGRDLAAAGRGVAVNRLEDRIAELERELRESRSLQLRVAELTDLVTELFLEADESTLPDGVLARYRSESL